MNQVLPLDKPAPKSSATPPPLPPQALRNPSPAYTRAYKQYNESLSFLELVEKGRIFCSEGVLQMVKENRAVALNEMHVIRTGGIEENDSTEVSEISPHKVASAFRESIAKLFNAALVSFGQK